MRLVAFDEPVKSKRPRRRDVGAPPTDALSRASWMHDVLCAELYDAQHDDRLSSDERRDAVLAISQRIIQAMPHHEIAAARDEIRKAERKSEGEKLEGEVTKRATKRSTRSLRASAPRRKE